MKISIVDYGVGNIYNITRAFDYLGVHVSLTRDIKQIRESDKLILPGVGSFESGISNLKKYGLDSEVKDFYKSGKPLLGICLGMQLLFDRSYEDGNWEGLGLISGEVKKFPESPERSYKIPHMCWNTVTFNKTDTSQIGVRIKEDVSKDPYFYFVHSYYVETNAENILLECQYAGKHFAAGVKKENLLAFQFHPERSGEAGLRLLKAFVEG